MRATDLAGRHFVGRIKVVSVWERKTERVCVRREDAHARTTAATAGVSGREWKERNRTASAKINPGSICRRPNCSFGKSATIIFYKWSQKCWLYQAAAESMYHSTLSIIIYTVLTNANVKVWKHCGSVSSLLGTPSYNLIQRVITFSVCWSCFRKLLQTPVRLYIELYSFICQYIYLYLPYLLSFSFNIPLVFISGLI